MARCVLLLFASPWVCACGDNPQPPARAETAASTHAAPESTERVDREELRPPLPNNPVPNNPVPSKPVPSPHVATDGLTVHTTLEAPEAVLDVAHEARPRSINPILVAGAGDAPGPRVFWLAYLMSPLGEVRGRAADEGRLEAWTADLERRVVECEETEDVPECDFCDSQCWRTVPAEIASRVSQVRVVRVSWPQGGSPAVDASEIVWTADELSDIRVRVRSIEDIDEDGHLELSLGIQRRNEWPAGDGADEARLSLYVDGETARLQLMIPRSFEQDGHGGSSTHETQVTFRDRNGDGVRDFTIRFQRSVGLNECFGMGDEEPPPECRDVDETHTGIYSSQHDEWRLPEGERWPWVLE